MIGFVLRIQINLINRAHLIFEGSGAQGIGRANYFGGWPTVSVSPKQLACSKSVDELVRSLAENLTDDCDYVFRNSCSFESDITNEAYDAYDFIRLIKEHIHCMTDIQSITMESKEYNDFCFYRSYTYEVSSNEYTCIMMGVNDSPCDDQEDEDEYWEIADEFDDYAPTIFVFSDAAESKIIQKERFYREADEDNIYSFRGCVIEKTETTKKKQKEKDINSMIPDCLGLVEFGRYPAGSDGEVSGIEWLILDKIDDRVMLLSKNVIDFLPAHKKSDRVTWETCSLRKWLNTDFINTSFTEEEQQWIMPTVLKADTTMSDLFCNICNDTEDRVFLLSAKECYKYFTTDASRAVNTTPYANTKRNEKGKGLINIDNFRHSWLLRNDSTPRNESKTVFSDGCVSVFTIFKNREIGGLRPAMWVNIELLNKSDKLIWSNDYNIIHAPDCHIINGTLTSCNENVSRITVPDGVTSIGSHAFMNCNCIEDIVLPDSVISINDNAFWSCLAKNINIPQNVLHIGKSSFFSCVKIVSINIPTSIESIEEGTFASCFSLEKVTIPGPVTQIAPDAFQSCPKITIYTPAGSYAETFAKENGIPCVAE